MSSVDGLEPLARGPSSRRSSTRNIGTPNNAMMAPTGSWRGAAAVRATRSAAANKVPPASAAAGTTTRCAAVPNASRTRCGITRPMKPMVPPWMTAPAVSRPANTTMTMRQRVQVEPQALRGGFAGGEYVERPRDQRHRQRG